MKLLNLNYFDKIYVISVKGSSLLDDLKKELEILNISKKKIKYYITDRIGNSNINNDSNFKYKCSVCCGKVCHELTRKYQNIYKHAIKNNFDNIFIFEDDARINSGKLPLMEIHNSIKWISENPNKWDVFYFGYITESIFSQTGLKHNIVKLNNIKLAHAHAINIKKCGKKLIDTIDNHNRFWNKNEALIKNKTSNLVYMFYDTFLYPKHIDCIYSYKLLDKYAYKNSLFYQIVPPSQMKELGIILDEKNINLVNNIGYYFGKYLPICILLYTIYIIINKM